MKFDKKHLVTHFDNEKLITYFGKENPITSFGKFLPSTSTCMGPVCQKNKKGGLCLVNPIKAIEVFLVKWVTHTLEPRDFNLQMLCMF